jgi:septum formation topological specificity factor MinE
MKRLNNDIIMIIKKYLKCNENSCNNYGIQRLHHNRIY